MLAAENVEVLMHGHLHQQYALHCLHGETQFLTIGAPTALSSRVRGEPNGYWLIEAASGGISLTLHLLMESGVFQANEPARFPRPFPAKAQGGGPTA